MKEVIRDFNGHNIRVIIQKGVEWFAGPDACDVLGIQKSGATFADFPATETARYSISTRSANGTEQKREVLFINEPGLYRLIFKSRKPEAESFKTWVFEEVLPSIRKTGKYDVRDIRAKSIEERNYMTAQWQRQGISKPQEYGSLTKTEYRELFGNSDLKKAEMNRSQILALSALESVEALKLDSLPSETLGYRGCENSLINTAVLVNKIRGPQMLKTPA
jgi:prophage antirepressor-like protein